MYKNKKFKLIPTFKTEDEERDFWATHDLTNYFDHLTPVKLDLSQLKPTPTKRVKQEFRSA
ncbi:MAG: hypothetical protein A2784_04820 [Candidatus Chisholmbacteria bacterium RIFCSPHIGHO2_01_FULL_48_12]|uniref:Uncharacterized protein n=1 Tax=Candidatus Chisholmbacteria bacterium RIFCSPHIGHO2_01_FULL_48_12 TaxID=1797589 RepID=A0A1G1VRF4_9BACT|nr:MAG: hypothetical protein A2784_04820 [Candidatus Chisholmbacteria bacterium RIFCSPHIGHO2_01_FULL_48_12]